MILNDRWFLGEMGRIFCSSQKQISDVIDLSRTKEASLCAFRFVANCVEIQILSQDVFYDGQDIFEQTN